MAKRGLSKAQIALQEARERMQKAANDVAEADNVLMAKRAVYTAHTEAYYALERTLSRPKSTAPSAAKKSSRKGVAQSSTVNTEGETVNALSASGD